MLLDDALAVKIGPTVAKEAPTGTIGFDLAEIETVYQRPLLAFAEARDDLAGLVGDEGMALVALDHAVVHFLADAVRGNHRHGIGHGVTLHHALPALMGVEAEIVGL